MKHIRYFLIAFLLWAAMLTAPACVVSGCTDSVEETKITTIDPLTNKKTIAERKVSTTSLCGDPKDITSESMSSDGSTVVVGGTSLIGVITSGGLKWLYIIGGVAIIGGIVIGVWAGQWLIGMAVSLGGGAVIGAGVMADQFPWVYLVFGVVAFAGVCLIVYQSVWGSKRDKAVTDIVAGNERFKDLATPNEISKFKTSQIKSQRKSTNKIINKKRGKR